MTSVLNEPKVEGLHGPDAATRLEKQVKEAVERVEKSVHDAKAAISEILEDGRIAAERLLKRSQYALEDGVEEAVHQVKRQPVSAVAIAFGAGIVLGVLLPRLHKK